MNEKKAVLALLLDEIKTNNWSKREKTNGLFLESVIESSLLEIKSNTVFFSLRLKKMLFYKISFHVISKESKNFYIFKFSKNGRKLSNFKKTISSSVPISDIETYLVEKEAKQVEKIISSTTTEK